MFSIGVVARQTGIEIGTLRKWESRYGFPQPARKDSGQRFYSESDIATLLQIARRITNGERVGSIIRHLGEQADPSPVNSHRPAALSEAEKTNLAALDALLAADFIQLKNLLEKSLSERTLLTYVEEIAAPLTEMVGEQWAQGKLPIHAEHLFSSVIESILTRETSLAKGANQLPVVLLTSPAGEHHTLGLSMVKAVLSEIGIGSLHLPGTLPLTEIVAAASVYQIRVVGLSASCHYPPRMLRSLIKKLRNALPEEVSLWFGGAGTHRISDVPPGVSVIISMQQLLATCQAMNLAGEASAPAVKDMQ